MTNVISTSMYWKFYYFRRITKIELMLNCYIVDDQQFSIDNISNYIEKINDLRIIDTFQDPIKALIALKKKAVDIVFLDVEMPNLSGIEFADLIDPSISIIFITSHSKYAIEAFEKDAEHFLLKPISFEKFEKAVEKVRRNRMYKKITSTHLSDHIFVNPGIKGKLLRIDLAAITHIEALEHSICIHQLDTKTHSKIGINNVCTQLPENLFIRVHRSFIINIHHIKHLEANSIELRNHFIIAFGETYKANFLKHISHLNISYNQI